MEDGAKMLGRCRAGQQQEKLPEEQEEELQATGGLESWAGGLASSPVGGGYLGGLPAGIPFTLMGDSFFFQLWE